MAPHLAGMKKKDLGLPHVDQATETQKRNGMCWSTEDELYNDGNAFKITCRDQRGVMVTLIADNYYGYCKKEVKTQISFAANLYGLAEEEHAGGAIAFPSYVLGQDFYGERTVLLKKATFDNAMKLLEGMVDIHPEGFASDKKHPDIVFVPEDAEFNVRQGTIAWTRDGETRSIKLRPKHDYVLPSGYKIRLQKQTAGTAWRLVGAVAHGTLCHKPCTVSGGGKSEISKSLATNILRGSVIVRDYQRDMDLAAGILTKDYSGLTSPASRKQRPRRHWTTSPSSCRQRACSPCPDRGGPDRDRTCDLGIKSPLLYQLSYRPAFRVYRRPPRIHWSRQGPHRLAVQVTALSRPQRGFESRWGHGRLAQLEEHLLYTQGVGGSSPSPPIRKPR